MHALAFLNVTKQPRGRPLAWGASRLAQGPPSTCAQTLSPTTTTRLIVASWGEVGANTHRPSEEPGEGQDGLSGRLMHLYSDQGKRKWGGAGGGRLISDAPVTPHVKRSQPGL